jgi:hypothetical protein
VTELESFLQETADFEARGPFFLERLNRDRVRKAWAAKVKKSGIDVMRPVWNLHVKLLASKAMRSGRGLICISCPDAGNHRGDADLERTGCRGCKAPILARRSLRLEALKPGPIHAFLCSSCHEVASAVEDPRFKENNHE